MDTTQLSNVAFPVPHVPLADDGGLGYNDIARTPDAYITVQVGPWDGFQDGDIVQIRWGSVGTVVGTRDASRADRGRLLDILVLAGDVMDLGEGMLEVTVRVQPKTGTPIDSTPAYIRVKLSVPGGADTDPETPYTNERLVSPTVTPDAVVPGKDTVSVKVPVYEHMTQGDLILVRWNAPGNDVVYGPLAPGEVGSAVVIPIDDAILRAGGAGDALKVSYQVYDRVHNGSLWSRRRNVDVEDDDAPVAPSVESIDDGKTLDVDALAGADVPVTVRGSGALSTDEVTVHWAGSTAAGLPVAFDTPPQKPASDRAPIDFVIPHAFVEPLAQGTAHAWYTVAPAGQGTVRTSLQHNLDVVGRVPRLIQPSVAEANDATLDPSTLAGDVAHALVPAWHGMQPGDNVELVGEGTTAGGEPVPWSAKRAISGSTVNRDVSFNVPHDILAALVGSRLRFTYLVTPFTRLRVPGAASGFTLAALRSDPLELDIRDASAGPRLAAPTIPELDAGGILDPDKTTTAHVVIPAYDAIARGDTVTIALRGGVDPFDDWLRVTSPAEPPSFTLPKPLVESYRGQTLTATYGVKRANGDTAISLPLVFRVGSSPATESDEPRHSP